ncbi:hypothetical protein [Nocardia nova]|uniref:hypothetical protein n=1 Tax=Nocardia nova TaxID=37330 RepID=UPI001FE82D96|nr:hypothetical protein [Nocardia nova]
MPGGHRIDLVHHGGGDGDALRRRQALGRGGASARIRGEVAVAVELDGLEQSPLHRQPIDELLLPAAPLIESDSLVQQCAAVSEVLGAVVVLGVTVPRRGQVDDDQVRVVDRGAVVDQQHHMVVSVDAGAGGSGVLPLVDQNGNSTGPGLQRFGYLVQGSGLLEPGAEYLAHGVAAVAAQPGGGHLEATRVVGAQHSHTGHSIVDTTVGCESIDLHDRVEQGRNGQIPRRGGNDVIGRPVSDIPRIRVLDVFISDVRRLDGQILGLRVLGVRIVGVPAHRSGNYRSRIDTVSGGELPGARGGRVIADRFAQDVARDGGGNGGGGISQRCREGVPGLGQRGIESAHTFGAVDSRDRHPEFGGEPVPQRRQVIQRLFIGEQRALQRRRGRGGLDMLTQCLRRGGRDAGLVQQLAKRVDGAVAFERGYLVREGRSRDPQQPGQARRAVRRLIRAGEVGVTAVLPGLGFGEGEGGHVGREGVVADESRGGLPQRTLLQFGCQLPDCVARRDDRIVGLGGGIGGMGGHSLFVVNHRRTYTAQMHGIANQSVLGRHHHLRATALTVPCGAVLGLLVDVRLLRGLGHPHVHAALGPHRIRYRDIDAALALPVDHQDLALLTGIIENLLQLGFPVRAPPDDPLGVDRFDSISRHPGAHQCVHLPGDEIVAVTQDLLKPAFTVGPHLVRVVGDRTQFGVGALDHVGGALHQPVRLRPPDLVRRLQTVDLLQHRVEVGESAGRTGYLIEERASGTVDFDRIDAFGGIRIRAHDDPMLLGIHPAGLGRADLLRFDGLCETRLTGLRAPP